jgi:anaerobic selenocysteine-containing dehydrogenase
VLSALASALGLDTGIDSQPTAFKALTTAVPFYASISDADIGGRGIRWQDTDAATSAPDPSAPSAGADSPDTQREGASAEAVPALGAHGEKDPADPTGGPQELDPSETVNAVPTSPGAPDSLALGTYRDLWAGPITELNPPLNFLQPGQLLEVSPGDAGRLDLKSGDHVRVSQGSATIEARVAIRERVADGVCFLAEGTAAGNANGLLNGGPVRVEIAKLERVEA